MTVFYDVEPSDVRKQTGDFGKAFKETCYRKTEEEKKKWSEALSQVAVIAGEHSVSWYCSKLLYNAFFIYYDCFLELPRISATHTIQKIAQQRKRSQIVLNKHKKICFKEILSDIYFLSFFHQNTSKITKICFIKESKELSTTCFIDI